MWFIGKEGVIFYDWGGGCSLTIKESMKVFWDLEKFPWGEEFSTIMNIQILDSFHGGTEEEYAKC